MIRSNHQHPLYPVTILATSLPIRSLYGTTPETMRLSAQLAAGLAGVLLVVPMYSLGRTLFDRRVGFWSAVLFQCLPVTARMLSNALSDALCLFLVASALALGCRALRTASPWRFALCGVFGGLAYLTRPEGILPVAVVGLVWLGMQVRVVQRSSVRRFSACAAALIVGALLAGGPLIAVTGRLSTKPAADAMLRNDAPALSAVPAAVTEARPAVDEGPSAANLAPAPSPGAAPTAASTPRSALGQSLWALGSILVRDFQWVGWLPALVSLWYFRASLWRQPEAWVLVLLCLLFGAALVRLNMVAGYLGERHAQMLVMCGSFGAVAVTAVLGDRLARLGHRRWLAPVLLAALTLRGLPVLGKPLHANQAGYRSAGLWLAAHAQPEDEIFDWHDSAKYYAGRLYPNRAAGALSITYAVVEEPAATTPCPPTFSSGSMR